MNGHINETAPPLVSIGEVKLVQVQIVVWFVRTCEVWILFVLSFCERRFVVNNVKSDCTAVSRLDVSYTSNKRYLCGDCDVLFLFSLSELLCWKHHQPAVNIDNDRRII